MTATFTPAEPIVQARHRVEEAVKELVPAADVFERPIWPGAASTLPTPTPMAGFQAAKAVAKLAEAQVHKYALALRGEGKSWREIADLMEIPWSEEYSRPERAFELCAGPQDSGRSSWSGPSVSWYCTTADGCGKCIIDRGPYNGNPRDDEAGHDDTCRRVAREVEAREREWEEQDARNAVMDEAYGKLSGFAKETADRARYVTTHGGRWLGWSTSESLAVALVLDDPDALAREGYSTKAAAIRRVFGDPPNPRALAGLSTTKAWIAQVRAAATGEKS